MSFTAETRQRSLPVLPLASLVDILFLLLAFFLTTSALREQEMQMGVELPQAESGATAVSPATQTIISIDADDRIFLGERELPLPTLRQTLQELVRVSPNDSVVVRGDRGSSWGLGVQVMDIAHQVGFRDVSVATVKGIEEIR